MMSIENKVNGNLIGYAEIYRTLLLENEKNKFIYHIEYHKMGDDSCVLKFNVIHDYNDGAEKLCLLVYEELNKILKK